MVREIEAGVFECERCLCHQTFEAEDRTNEDAQSRARQEASIHQGRNAPHIAIVDLSILPHPPNKPDTMRRGSVVALKTLKKGLKILSRRVYAEEQGAAEEASFLVKIAADADLAREEEPRGRRRIRNSIPA